MSGQNDFFERLRAEGRRLRYEPDDAVLWNRLSATIRGRIAPQPSVAQSLSRWFRPVTASLVMLALAAALSIAWLESSRDSVYSVEAMGSNSVEITVGGDTFSLAE